MVNTAAKGAAGTYSRIVSKKVLLCYAPEKPSILAPSAGYITQVKKEPLLKILLILYRKLPAFVVLINRNPRGIQILYKTHQKLFK